MLIMGLKFSKTDIILQDRDDVLFCPCLFTLRIWAECSGNIMFSCMKMKKMRPVANIPGMGGGGKKGE
jgi:hypothetical protein